MQFPGDGAGEEHTGPDRSRARSQDQAHERRQVADVVALALRGVPRERAQARLCRVCVDLLPVSGASISIVADDGVRAIVCSSDDVSARLAEAQYTLGDGPCLEAARLGAPVFAPDLTDGRDARRWPVFAQQALELGVEAVFSLPLSNGGLAVGTVDLYRATAGSLTVRQSRVALLAVDAIAFAMAGLHAAYGDTEDGGVASWLDDVEAHHDEVHQATGMIMMQLGTGVEEARARLRGHAFAYGQTVTEAARDVIEHRVRFDE